MDVAQILGLLWKRRALVALGAVAAIVIGILIAYKPSLSNGLERRTLELGVASNTLLVDTQKSSVIDLQSDLSPLSSRARAYATVASSDPILRAMARDVGIPRESLVTDTAPGGEQNAEDRTQSIIRETGVYRVAFNASEEQPLVEVSTQGPTEEIAVKIADSAHRSLSRYVVREQDRQNVPPFRRVTIRQVGPAQGGVINSGANLGVAFLTGLAVFAGACLLILFGDRLRVDLRRGRAAAYNGQAAVSPLTGPRGDARRGEHPAVDLDKEMVRERRTSRLGG